jgi:hypothetical protein
MVAPQPETPAITGSPPWHWIGKFLVRGLFVVLALGLYLTYRHYNLAGRQAPALASLGGAAVFVWAAIRGLLGRLRQLAFVLVPAAALLGYWQGAPLVDQFAQSPFAIMGAMQAVTHQNHPRSAEQAAALRQFANSLTEVGSFAGGDLRSPANAARALQVIGNIVTKAEYLGATELRSDPGFQNALRNTALRTGIGWGLDTADAALRSFGGNASIARQVTELQQRLREVRRRLDAG